MIVIYQVTFTQFTQQQQISKMNIIDGINGSTRHLMVHQFGVNHFVNYHDIIGVHTDKFHIELIVAKPLTFQKCSFDCGSSCVRHTHLILATTAEEQTTKEEAIVQNVVAKIVELAVLHPQVVSNDHGGVKKWKRHSTRAGCRCEC